VIAIRLLGDLEVWRGGHPVGLPPSKKTRALLAYLVLTGRTMRREQLCDMFWDVTDDPRAALRWSLSKLRALVDDDDATRLEATREDVTFRAHGAEIDATTVRGALGGRSLQHVDTAELERLAAMFRGELLEGLELPDFDVYQAWSVAQREEMRGIRATLLGELVHRLASEPARAVDHARVHVQIDPHDAKARAALITILGALGRKDEAQAHFESGRRRASESPGADAVATIERAWRAVERSPMTRRAVPRAEVPLATAPTPLVGRDDDLAALDRWHRAAVASTRLVIGLFTGEAGAGKSRVVADWSEAARARGTRIAAGISVEAVGRPYGVWLDVLRQLAGDDDQRTELAHLARGTGEAAAVDRDRLFDGVAAELARAAPAVIVLDDSHWLDPGSAALLAHVARACADRPLAIVVLARSGELADNAALARVLRSARSLARFEERELAPLGEADTAALVHALAPDADAGALYARSGGNPLFALELARASADATTLPVTIAAAIRERLETLPDDAAQALRWGAVLGHSFGVDELEALAGLAAEVAVEAIELLARRALLGRDSTAPGTYRFAHELVRQVVYEALSEPRRRLMHRRVAQALAPRAERGEVDIAIVAHHAAQAQDAALAAQTCLAAARRSLRVFAVADAYALARRGIRQAEALGEPDRTRRTLELLDVSLAARRPLDTDAVARQVEELAERALDFGCIEHARLGYHLLGYLRWEHGSWLEAKRYLLQAQLVSRGGSEPEQIVGLAEAARCLVLLEKDLAHAHALALEAAARGRTAGVEPTATFAALGMLHLHRGEIDDARAELDRALALARARRDRYDEYLVLEQLVMLDVDRDERGNAAERAETLVSLGTRFREGSEGPFSRGLLALARGEQDAIDVALDELATVDAKQRLAYLATRAAWSDAEDGSFERAGQRARRALAAASVLDRATEVALAHSVLVRVARARGDTAGEREHGAEIAARWPRIATPIQRRVAGAGLAPPPPNSDPAEES
jgi:DNA-binding SARP family transcriptional activator